MTLQAVDGRALAFVLAIALGVILLTIALRRESKRIDQVIPQILDAPTPPQLEEPQRPEFACLKYVCRGCRRPTHEHVTDWDRILHLVTEWTCPDCVVIAAYETEFAS